MVLDAIRDLPPLRDVIRAHALNADKRLGQNFLLDLNLTQRIARAAGDLSTGTTIEIGPGPGGLTRALLLCGAMRVVAIEKDPRCVAALVPLVQAAAGRLDVISADATTVAPESLGPPPHRIVANLPYNIGTHLLVGWLQRMTVWSSLTLMFQREVADRITARVGGPHYGRLAVLSQLVAQPKLLFDVQASAFVPPPSVTSAIVHLTPKPGVAPDLLAAVEAVTSAAFGQRRKMLRQSLKPLGIAAEDVLPPLGIDPTRRAETLSVADFVAIAGVWLGQRRHESTG